MFKNILVLCFSIVLSVSVFADGMETTPKDEINQTTIMAEAPSCESDSDQSLLPWNDFSPSDLKGTELASGCCKVCKKGKACGNSCIAKSKTCHKGRGCACDG